ncbi:hypothetical protein B0H16DRAFT_428963 [Mycena metata]|uniref:Uncharacterized protein n=1 Tax=Mycena metata TaxID=1033252 RepID=A0AAD7JH83_9AGAR|nr:hypothetical protein B0H16DRAFT_428963 [Mycena metata]
MLTTISRLDKLAAAAVSFRGHGMLVGTTSSYTAMVFAGDQPQIAAAAAVRREDDDEEINHGPKSLSSMELPCLESAARGYPKELVALAAYIQQPRFPALFRHFLHDELHEPVEDVVGIWSDCTSCCELMRMPQPLS